MADLLGMKLKKAASHYPKDFLRMALFKIDHYQN
jgi:hypothetical protein